MAKSKTPKSHTVVTQINGLVKLDWHHAGIHGALMHHWQVMSPGTMNASGTILAFLWYYSLENKRKRKLDGS